MTVSATLQPQRRPGPEARGSPVRSGPAATRRSARDGDAPPIVGEALREPGRPLDPAARAVLEPRFGHDFARVAARDGSAPAFPARLGLAPAEGPAEAEAVRMSAPGAGARRAGAPGPGAIDLGRVRVHTGPRAAASARAIDALAYTVGPDIVFGESAYAPDSEDGRRLIAHELAHVRQQQRGEAPVAVARVSLAPGDFDALADEVHGAISGQAPDASLADVALQKLERDAAAIRSLRSAYRARFKSDLEKDLRAKLAGPDLALALELIGVAPAGGAVIAAAAPATQAQFDAAAGRLKAALAGQAPDGRTVIATLLPLNREAAAAGRLKAAYQAAAGRALETDLQTKLAGSRLAYALYLLNAPPPAAAGGPSQITLGSGTAPASAPPAVEGGQVSAQTAVPYTTASGKSASLSFAVSYAGALAAESRWLQFIWRDIEVTGADGRKKFLNDTVTVGSRSYPLTTDPKAPGYSVDSRSGSDPFYEASTSTARREPNLTTIGDAPTPIRSLVQREFNGGATAVVSRAHFEIYLIRDFRALYHVGVDVEHPFRDATHYTTNRAIRVTETVSALPGPLQKALVRDYPAFAYIQ